MNVLDVCSGGGIGAAVTRQFGWRTVCYVENDNYCQQLLVQRVRDGWINDAPIWDDLTTFDGTPWRGRVDIIVGGIPCQPFSLAGQRQGDDDPRNLWPAFRRVLCEVGPPLTLIENVSGLLAAGRGGQAYIGTILGELSEVGYDAEWRCLSAAELGAPHKRDRVWIVAYATGAGETAGEFTG